MKNEKSLLLQVVGDSPKLRVLDFLITFQKFDYSMKDIARNSKIGYATLQLFWPDFVKAGLVKQTRIIGKAKLFQANIQHPAMKLLSRLQFAVASSFAEKFREKIAVPARRSYVHPAAHTSYK